MMLRLSVYGQRAIGAIYGERLLPYSCGGYLLGNPLTFPEEDNFKIRFCNGIGIISDDLYKSLFHACDGEYRSEYISPYNLECIQNLELYEQCIYGIQAPHVLEPYCGSHFWLIKLPTQKPLKEHTHLTSVKCRDNGYKLVYYWINDDSVQEALHIRKGIIEEWIRCPDLNFTITTYDVRQYHLSLSNKGYCSLIYSGDHDMLIPHQSTQAWTKGLNYSVIDQWQQWKHNNQIAGYIESYSNMMTYATVKESNLNGGGHTAPQYKPEECFSMFKRWISNQPL
ncbi:hypothetical protein R6Q57_012930 [Mikania cordata]